jgi:hypothetical protein
MVKQPVIRRSTPVCPDNPKRILANFSNPQEKLLALQFPELADTDCRLDPRTPEDFVPHPITDTGKVFLHQQEGFEWCPRLPP